jgi:hypothetical protein
MQFIFFVLGTLFFCAQLGLSNLVTWGLVAVGTIWGLISRRVAVTQGKLAAQEIFNSINNQNG